MDGLNGAFYLGLLGAIPLAIAANLLTPKAQKFLEARAEASKRTRVELLDRRIESARRLQRAGLTPTDLLIDAVITATWIGSIGGVAASLCFTAVSVSAAFPSQITAIQLRWGVTLWPIFQISGTIMGAITGLIVLNVLRRGRRLSSDLREVEKLELVRAFAQP